MKRILFLTKDVTQIGGREKIILRKANDFVNMDFDVKIVSHFNKSILSDDFKTIKYGNLRFDLYYYSSKYIKFFLFFYFKFLFKVKLKKIVNEYNPDVIIVTDDYGFLEVLKLNKKIKKYIEIHGSYDFYHQNKIKSDFISKIREAFFKNKVKKLKNKLRDFDKVIILSDIDRDKWGSNNIDVLPNYVNKSSAEYNNKYKEKQFISAGRLSHEKGFDILIDVWEVIKNKKRILKLDIYGEGEEYNHLKEKIRKKGLNDYISIFDFTNNIEDIYPEYCAYILPSRYECLPMVAIESINVGVPVIGFNLNCGLRDIIIDNYNGFLIPEFELEEMANKIILLADDRVTRNKLALNGMRHAEKFHDQVILDKWRDILNNE